MPFYQTTAQDTWDSLACDEVDHEGNKHWYDERGRHHRDNGPAIITAGAARYWCKHGLRHREDGPAFIRPDGYVEYWIDGDLLTEEQFNHWKNSNAT